MIKCNAGTQTTDWIGDFPGYPEPVWYDPSGITNIISLKQANKYFVSGYHSEDRKSFVVTH